MNVLSKSSVPHPRMWRFYLLSAATHVMLGALFFDPVDSIPLLPTPELTVVLNEIAAHPRTRGPVTANIPVLSTPQAQSKLSTAQETQARPDARSIPDDPHAQFGQQQRRNHLQSLLRAAFEEQFVYPPLARRHGWQGRVRIALWVEADGRFRDLHVLQSSGHASLDHDALQTLERIGQLAQARMWLEGQAMRVELPVIYRLLES